MAYSEDLADRVRECLLEKTDLPITEKKMFGGLAFLVDDKMCINIGEENLMCRFNPEKTEEIAERIGFLPCIMGSRELKGYCYVEEIGYRKKQDFEFWIDLCLEFNKEAKSSKKRKKKDTKP